jgi:hypothetical protein
MPSPSAGTNKDYQPLINNIDYIKFDLHIYNTNLHFQNQILIIICVINYSEILKLSICIFS